MLTVEMLLKRLAAPYSSEHLPPTPFCSSSTRQSAELREGTIVISFPYTIKVPSLLSSGSDSLAKLEAAKKPKAFSTVLGYTTTPRDTASVQEKEVGRERREGTKSIQRRHF